MAPTPRTVLAACIASLILTAASAQTQSPSASSTRIDSVIASLEQVRSPVNAILSPDGRQLAWTFGSAEHSELHLTQLTANGSPEPNTPDRLLSPDTIANPTNSLPGACPTSHPAWSPDGTQLAFLARCTQTGAVWQPTTQDDIFVLKLATNTLSRNSHLHGAVSSIQWSPDSKSIAFLYVEGATRRAGALDAMKPWNGVYGEDGVEVQTLALIAGINFGSDATTPSILARIVPQSSPLLMAKHGPDIHVYEFSWAPDSQHLVFVGAPPPGENNWWIANLFSVAVPTWEQDYESLHLPQLLFSPATTPGPLHNLQIAVPRFSPDGKSIAFIGGIMSDQGSIGGDIYTVPAAGLARGQQPTDVTPNDPASPAWFTWLDNQNLAVSEHLGGSTHITSIDIRTGKNASSLDLTLPETVSATTDAMSASFATHSTNIALIRESFSHPPEVYAGPLTSDPTNLHQISHLNDSIHPSWGKSESITYTNGGFNIQGWLLYPTNYDPQKKYPLIVSVHGGPSSAATPRWPTAAYGSVPFSALGYFVFLPNPRGSFGQGEKFTQANIRDFGYGDLSDILAGVDLLEKRFPIDKQREGVTGWSYGGFMTMFAVTQTTRFKAAVAGAGLANWQSYYGENSIDQWMLPFFGASVYDDPAIYARSSPINFIKQVKTPTLMIVGDRDGECPAPQSFEFWHALRDLDVKTQLVIYPNEGHHFVDPAHQHDALQRALNWFETEMPPS